MRKPTAKKQHLIKLNQTYAAEGLEVKLRKILETKEPIDEVAPTIYTDKKDGVMPGFDIRTDRFDVAMDAIGKMRSEEASRIAKGQSTPAAEAPEAMDVGQEPS